MDYILSILLLIILAVVFGMLHRGQAARGCHSCANADDTAECGSCPVKDVAQDRALARSGRVLAGRAEGTPESAHLHLERTGG